MAKSRRGRPEDRQQALQAALARYHAGDVNGAMDGAVRLLRDRPRDGRALGLLAMCQAQVGQFEAALENVDRAIALKPKEALPHTIRARALRMLGRTDESLAAFDRASALDPSHEGAASGRAQLLLALGRQDDAAAALAPFLSGDAPSHSVALVAARVMRARDDVDGAIALLRRSRSRPGVVEGALQDIDFLLADLLDAAGRYDEAMATLHDVCARRGARFDPALHASAVDAMIKSLSVERWNALPRLEASFDGPAPIFIVGLPRSGTTLVERILSMHAEVEAAGELDAATRIVMRLQAPARPPIPGILQQPQLLSRGVLREARAAYLAALGAGRDGARFVTDKMPGNLLHLPLLRLMFPAASIIRCVRDPRDTAVSCYFQHFGARGLEWTYRPAFIASYFRDSERAYAHFTESLGIDVIEASYESLASDPERETRRLVEASGLPWDEACLRPHEKREDARTRSADQVTRPIHTGSVARWKRYEREVSGWGI